MIIEYIVDKDIYKKLLTNIDFTASNGQVVTKKSSQAKGKDNFYFKLSCVKDDIKTAQALSEIDIKIQELFNQNGVTYRILLNEASQFFVKQLYPYVCEFETKLRKFIHSTLFDVNEEAQLKVEAKIKGAFEKKHIKEGFHKIDFLEQGSLEEIVAFLFANDDLYGELKAFTKANRLSTRQELLNFIEKSEKRTIWEEFFIKDFGDSVLPDIYKDIIDCRNDVMHLHNIRYEQYLKELELLKNGIRDLNTQIRKGIVIESSEENVVKLSGNTGYLQGIIKSLATLGTAVQKIMQTLYTPSYLATLEKLGEMVSNIPQIHIPEVLFSSQNIAMYNTLSQIAASSLSSTAGLESALAQDDEEQDKEGETEDDK